MDENILTGGAEPQEGTTAPAVNIEVETTAPDRQAPAPEAKAAEPAPEADDAAREEAEQARKSSKLPEWAQKRFDQFAFEKREAERRARDAERQLQEYRDQLERRQPATPTTEDRQAAIENSPDPNAQWGGYRSKAEFDVAVKAEADRRFAVERQAADERAFNEECNRVYQSGKGQFSDFDDAIGNLRSLGVLDKTLIDAALATEQPDRVLYEIGSDPDKAMRIMALPPAKRIVELTKLSLVAPAPPPQRRVSSAPAPVRPVEGTARASTGLRDDDDEGEWFRKRSEQVRSRNR